MLRSLPLKVPLHLTRTLGPIARGNRDPSLVLKPKAAQWAFATPEGDAALNVRVETREVQVEAFGPGAAWALERIEDCLGLHDEAEAFRPEHPELRQLVRRMVGVRFPRVERVSDLLWPAILGQLVKGQEATRAFRLLTERYGRDAPGPHGLRIPPSARELSELSMDAFLSVGALRDHAERIRFVGKRQTRIDKMAALPAEAFSEALLRYPGIGPWTVASVRARGLGDADAVIVGDYHLPNLISWFFAGEDRGDDARMLELLEPFRGHRARVIRVLELSGLHAPRYGPKRGMRALRR